MFPTAENLKAAVTEEANLVTHMVSVLLFRLCLTTTGNLLATQSRALLHGAPPVPLRQLSSWPVGTHRLSPQLQQNSQRLGWERTL